MLADVNRELALAPPGVPGNRLMSQQPAAATTSTLSTAQRRHFYFTAAVTGAAIRIVEILGAKPPGSGPSFLLSAFPVSAFPSTLFPHTYSYKISRNGLTGPISAYEEASI
jgi:hypothetical protein